MAGYLRRCNGGVVWTVRPAGPGDNGAILEVVGQAFTGPDHDGQEEVDIVLQTWQLGAGIEGLELVADVDGTVVGHVLGARADLQGRELLAIAPLAVAPTWQGRGIGSALMTELLDRADDLGWPMAVLLGNPEFYGRFGFEAAGPLGLVYRPVGQGDPHFQARRLSSFESSLRGEVRYCWEIATG